MLFRAHKTTILRVLHRSSWTQIKILSDNYKSLSLVICEEMEVLVRMVLRKEKEKTILKVMHDLKRKWFEIEVEVEEKE